MNLNIRRRHSLCVDFVHDFILFSHFKNLLSCLRMRNYRMPFNIFIFINFFYSEKSDSLRALLDLEGEKEEVEVLQRSNRTALFGSYMLASSQHSSDRPVNIAKLKPHNLWAVWSKRRPGAIPWIMAPLTRLELRRAVVRPVLLRLAALWVVSSSFALSSSLSIFLFLLPPLQKSPVPITNSFLTNFEEKYFYPLIVVVN